MTISSATNTNDYTGTGALDTYSYTFEILNQSHLVLTIADDDGVEVELTITTDYTVTGVGEASGGTIVFVDSGQDWLDASGFLKTDYLLNIRQVVPLVQNTDIRNQGAFFPATYESALDYITRICQQLQEQVSRAVLSGATEATTTVSALSASIAAAQAAETNAEAAQAAAEAAQTGAESAETDAQTAQTNAETAETNAETAETNAAASAAAASAAAAALYPVGIVITLGVSTNPNALFGFGTWTQIKGKVIVGIADSGTFNTLDADVGAETINLQHNHGGNTGGVNHGAEAGGETTAGTLDTYHMHSISNDLSASQSIVQPGKVKYIWERTS